MATTWKEAEPGGAATVPSAETPDRTLEVVVVYTTTQATVQALKIASTLARGLSARIRLLVPQMVPYILPLSSPPISEDGMRQRLRDREMPVRERGSPCEVSGGNGAPLRRRCWPSARREFGEVDIGVLRQHIHS